LDGQREPMDGLLQEIRGLREELVSASRRNDMSSEQVVKMTCRIDELLTELTRWGLGEPCG